MILEKTILYIFVSQILSIGLTIWLYLINRNYDYFTINNKHYLTRVYLHYSLISLFSISIFNAVGFNIGAFIYAFLMLFYLYANHFLKLPAKTTKILQIIYYLILCSLLIFFIYNINTPIKF